MAGNSWVQAVVLIIIGILVYLAGLVLKLRNDSRRPYAGYAEAKVVDIVPIERERYAPYAFRNRQCAVFEFFADGKLVKVTDQADTYPCPYHMNQYIRLCYDPDDPQKFRIIRKEWLLYGSIALKALGVLLFLGGVLLFLIYARRYVV
ncbi:MAG: hypothetical protein LUF30_04490 [Lachnospiraceae bacterium]|nr:hypothetical protein [Lachnospiraceae bacterium]